MKKIVGFVLSSILLSACGGGGTASLPGGGTAPGVTPALSARSGVTFTLAVPAQAQSAATARTPQYVSASMQSLAVTLTAQNGTVLASPQAYAVNVSSCPMVSGVRTCSLSVPASVGTDTFTVATYDAAQSSSMPATLTGNVLSTASLSATVVVNTANTLALTLSGVVHSMTLALSNATPSTGAPATIALSVTARDADGNVIIGPGNYSVPITLADSDTSGATTLSTTSVTSPSTTVTFAYTGAPASATFSASTSTGITATAPHFVTQITKIYVVDYSSSSVKTFTPNGTETTPTITAGLDYPEGIAVDKTGKIYVVDYYYGTVTTYLPNGTQTTPTISGLYQPKALAIGSNGKIYVADSGNDQLKTYNADGTPGTPATIPDPSYPYGIAVDPSGNIYASNSNNTVTTYNASGTQIAPTITGLSDPDAMTIDSAGKIYVDNYNGGVGGGGGMGTVTTYLPSGAATTPVLSTGINNPDGTTIDPAGNIYVTNYGAISLTIYNASGTLLQTVTAGITGPEGVAVY